MHRQAVRVTRVHSADKRIDHIVQQLTAQAARYERRQRLVVLNSSTDKEIAQHSDFRSQR